MNVWPWRVIGREAWGARRTVTVLGSTDFSENRYTDFQENKTAKSIISEFHDNEMKSEM